MNSQRHKLNALLRPIVMDVVGMLCLGIVAIHYWVEPIQWLSIKFAPEILTGAGIGLMIVSAVEFVSVLRHRRPD